MHDFLYVMVKTSRFHPIIVHENQFIKKKKKIPLSTSKYVYVPLKGLNKTDGPVKTKVHQIPVQRMDKDDK